ncbi:LEM domain protein [Oesophagostomum dentatum]|uniref:LEM domain protein n=1 Tax=Oesophagostomum dentatum TaxID=61180 RepID=A0A0B1SK03_OESDE|nr:LEM domain protein [Oesophagostomum dentatum]
MKDVALLSESELRDELESYNVNVGPVTGTTRSLYEKKLLKLRKQGPPQGSSSSPTKPKVPPPKRPVSKSPSRTTTATRSSTLAGRRKINSSESEDGSDEATSEKLRYSKVITSTPEPSPESSPRPSLSPLKPSVRPSDSRSYNSSSLSSLSRPSAHFISNYQTDRPGATPPRKAALPKTPPRSPSTRVTTTASYTIAGESPLDRTGLYERTNRSVYGTTSPIGSRGLLDLGNTTGEEDDDDEDGQESSRIVYTTKRSGPEKRSPLKKAWDRLLGYDVSNVC